MKSNLIARKTVTIKASVARVWEGLTNPAMISEYMFGAKVTSEWKPGASITWSGLWQGKTFEDKGMILEMVPGKLLKYTYFSLLSGLPDMPENYRTITIELKEIGETIQINLAQDNNPTKESRDHSEKNWEMVLSTLRQILEK